MTSDSFDSTEKIMVDLLKDLLLDNLAGAIGTLICLLNSPFMEFYKMMRYREPFLLEWMTIHISLENGRDDSSAALAVYLNPDVV